MTLHKKIKLSPNHEKIFSKQIIDYYNPGSVLKDFETLLEFIGNKSIRVSGVNNLLPLKVLPEINSILTKPIQLDLKRPQQKSYPHINSLWLLLRTTGMGYVVENQEYPLFVIDEKANYLWENMNKTERYFSLLEAWLCRGNEKILGDHNGIKNYSIMKCIDFYKKFSEKELYSAKDSENKKYKMRNQDLLHIAMMELFGIIHVEHGLPLTGKGWHIEKISVTKFGYAVIDTFLNVLDIKTDQNPYVRLINENIEEYFIIWSSLIRPYFPEFKKLLEIHERVFIEGIHLFKILIGKKIWRRIAIPGTMVLDNLSASILESFNFDDDHLYQYIYENRYGETIIIDHPLLQSENPKTNNVRVGDIPLVFGMNMLFLYDFGDHWLFKVELEKIDPEGITAEKAIVIEKNGKAPKQYG